MTIDEAIKVLGEYVYEDKACPVGLFDEATRLSIEALKRIQKLRSYSMTQVDTRLPGETMD